MSYPIIDALAGSWLMADGRLYDFSSETTAQLRKPAGHLMYYEVVRIADNTPLFWDDHMERLVNSIGSGFELRGDLLGESKKLLKRHLQAGCELEGLNLRIVVTPEIRVIHLIPSYYPDLSQLSRGVSTLVINWERENPNVKVIKPDYKAAVAQGFARKTSYGSPFELLLADRHGMLTEGSRSNLFFIRRNEVLSAPDDRILLGVTRKYVMQAIERAGARLKVEMITADELADGTISAAFLSGSPIDLLPISSIGEISLPSASNELFVKVNYEYHNIMREWLASHTQYRS